MDKSLLIKQVERKNITITKWLAISHIIVIYITLVGFILAYFLSPTYQQFMQKHKFLWPIFFINTSVLTWANYLCWKLIINCFKLEKLLEEKKKERK